MVITTENGCKDTSADIEITFIGCGCVMDASLEVECGHITVDGYQSYYLTLQVNNTLGAGANINITSPGGTVTSISPTSLAPGLNTVTATYVDVPPVSGSACFDIVIFTSTAHCDTTICIEHLPDCDSEQCDKKVETKSVDCIGYDTDGNPIYEICANVFWGGSNGSTLTLNSPGNVVSPNTFTVNNGTQLICFNYTDLPPTSPLATVYFNFFDSLTSLNCRDSLITKIKPCPEDTCRLEVLGICAHCRKKTEEGQEYNLVITINNTLGTLANVNVLPISGGVFGTISPNPVPPGISDISIPFTDTGVRDSIICFRVIIQNDATICWADICVYLPDCEHTSLESISGKLSYFVVYPNPASDRITLTYNMSGNHDNRITVSDMAGRTVMQQAVDNSRSSMALRTGHLAKGLYHINFVSDGRIKGSIKFIRE